MVVKKKQPPRQRPRVTVSDVIDAAIEIVDRDGIEALTIRRVADVCGLSPMGVYRHVRDKDDLLDRIVDTVVTQSVDQLHATGPWDEQILALFRNARRLLLQHPGVAVLSVLRPTPVVGVARFYDRVLAALADGGLEGPAAVHAFDTLLMFMFGSILWEIPRSPDIRTRLVTVALDDDATSHVIARAAELSERDPTAYYDAGLHTILNGLANRTVDKQQNKHRRSRPKPGP